MSDKDKAAPVGEREAFEVWLGIRPCGAAHDLAREAFKAGAAYQRAQQPQSAEAVAYVTGYHGGRCIIEPLNRAAVLPTGMALYSHPQPQSGLTEAEPGCFVQPVPSHCDRITWRGQYYHLPIAAPQPSAGVVMPECTFCNGTGYLETGLTTVELCYCQQQDKKFGTVMPSRKEKPDGFTHMPSHYEGWNACLDEFARLNGKEVGRG